MSAADIQPITATGFAALRVPQRRLVEAVDREWAVGAVAANDDEVV